MTMAKGIANGMPHRAPASRRSPIADSWKAGNISTFGGNPITTAAASATIDVIVEEKLSDNADGDGQGPPRRPRGDEEEVRQGRSATSAARASCRPSSSSKDETASDRTPDAAATSRLFEETKKRGLLIGTRRPLRQRHPHRAAAQRHARRDRRGPEGPRRVVRRLRRDHAMSTTATAQPAGRSDGSPRERARRQEAALLGGRGARRGRALPLLRRRAVHQGLPHRDRHPDVHQEDRDAATCAAARKTIFEQNLLGYSCARVCPVEVLCVGACVYNGWEREPIADRAPPALRDGDRDREGRPPVLEAAHRDRQDVEEGRVHRRRPGLARVRRLSRARGARGGRLREEGGRGRPQHDRHRAVQAPRRRRRSTRSSSCRSSASRSSPASRSASRRPRPHLREEAARDVRRRVPRRRPRRGHARSASPARRARASSARRPGSSA